MRSALSEISDRISVFPPSLVARGVDVAPADGRGADGRGLGTSDLISSSLDALARRAAEGLPQAAAAFAMLAETPRSRLDRAAEAIASTGEERTSQALYRLASEADAEDREGDAAVILCVLAGTDWGEVDGCLGLAVIAARRKRFDEALALASFCLQAEARHPRALGIVAICELQRGNVAAAQSYLAAAARLARSNPALRQELQAAQRALLLMHLAS